MHPNKAAALEKRQLERQLRADGFSKRGAQKQISRNLQNLLLGTAGNLIHNPSARKKNSP